MYQILGIVHLILLIIGIISVLGSSLSLGMKVVWIAVILLLPVIGLILWFLIGNKSTAVA